jgi:Leucine-rich repeat (LRR) protein
LRKSIVIVVIGLATLSSSVFAQVLLSDSLALVALYNNTGGSTWTTKTNWLTGPVSTWFGITRTGNRVTYISLTNNNLTGPLPAAIGNLSALTGLEIQNNKLSGSIPAEIGNIVTLKFLYLWGNQFTGGIPTSMGNLVLLEQLWLNANQLTGAIPAAIGNLVALKYLTLRDNQLSGNIPASLGNLVNLEFLYLNNNQLSGSIPAELGNLTNLKDLYLSGNQLTGSIPTALGNLNKLLRLVGNNNKFTGSLPSELTNMLALRVLDLQDNNLTGAIPTQIGNLINLTHLLLGNAVASGDVKNQFTGSLPISISSLTSLTVLKIKDNKLSGAVPSSWGNLFNLEEVDLSNNEFTALPDLSGLPFITLLDVSNNLLTFQHLYTNRNITGFVYAPQKSNQIQSANPNQDSQAPVGNPYTITVADNTPGSSYVWKHNDVLMPLLITNTVQIQVLNRATMGTYSCEITNTNIPLLTFYFTQKVEATANFSGTLFIDTNEPAQVGAMQLFAITETGPYTLIQTQDVDSEGGYTFSEVVLGDYIVSGFAKTDLYPKAIPTWYEQSIYWEEAEPVLLEDNTTGIDIVSAVRPDAPTEGQGIITGTFYEVFPDAGKMSARSRVANAAVTVRRVERAGRGKEEILTLIDYVFTNDQGEFEFVKLEVGEYRLNIQYPGYPMDEESFITIPIGNTLFDRQVAVEAEVIHGKIVVRKLIITGWQDEKHTLQAYPNPGADYLYVTGAQNEDVTFQMVESNGRSVSVIATWNAENKRWTLDVSNLNPGLYILNITHQDKQEILRIIIK